MFLRLCRLHSADQHSATCNPNPAGTLKVDDEGYSFSVDGEASVTTTRGDKSGRGAGAPPAPPPGLCVSSSVHRGVRARACA